MDDKRRIRGNSLIGGADSCLYLIPETQNEPGVLQRIFSGGNLLSCKFLLKAYFSIFSDQILGGQTGCPLLPMEESQ